MDIKKVIFERIKDQIETAYTKEKDTIAQCADLFTECALNGGVVQLFGVNHGEEFVNELNFRAGGLAPFHGLKVYDLILNEKVDKDVVLSGKIWNEPSHLDTLLSLYKLDPRDCYVLVSFYGNEPLMVALAKRMKDQGHKIVAVVNKASYEISEVLSPDGKICDYADLVIDMCAEEPDVATTIHGYNIGQLSSTTANVIAQMITAQGYVSYKKLGKEAPILLSANVKGADVHNSGLTDPYEGRVR